MSVNGGRPGWFILDSGGNSCGIDRAFARARGLRPIQGGQSSGAGRGTVPYDLYARSVQFAVNGLSFSCDNAHVIGIDLSGQPAIIGVHVDGFIGTDFFIRHVVEIDYARRVVRVYDPATFQYAGAGCHVPMTIERRLPHIPARLTVNGTNSANRSLLVDTGSQSAVDEAWINQSANLHSGTGGVGIGQSYQTRIGRFSTAEIGCFSFTDIPGSGDGVPLVGGEVLRHFTLTFDWLHADLIMDPDAGVARSLADTGVTGLDFRAAAHGAVVIDTVSPDTPAALAGFLAGDVLVSVDGTAASAFEFSQLGQLFRRNRSYSLGIRRGGAASTLTLTV
ncbi:MAG: aspartyl protease family protein [Vitreimonas sp.]